MKKNKKSKKPKNYRFLQPEGVHPVSAPAGLHHLQHVADGGGAGDPGHRGPDQPGQSGGG